MKVIEKLLDVFNKVDKVILVLIKLINQIFLSTTNMRIVILPYFLKEKREI